MLNTPSKFKLAPIPIFLFFLFFGFRLIGISWGLKDAQHNQSLHPDEELNFTVSQAIQPAQFNFCPGYYSYGTLYFTIQRVADDVTSAYFGGPVGPVSQDWSFIARCELAGRIISAIAGALIGLLVYFILCRLTNLFGSVLGSCSVAFAPGMVVHSRFATVDILATLFVTLCLWQAVRLSQLESSERNTLLVQVGLAGLFAGLSAGTKYSGEVAIIAPIVVLALKRVPQWWLWSGYAFLVSVVTFVITTPAVIFDRDRFISGFLFEVKHAQTGHGLTFVDTAPGPIFHLSNLIIGFGLIGLVLGIGGLIYYCIKKQGWAIAMVAFFALYFLAIGRAEVKFFRYVLPLMVPVACGLGVLTGEADLKRGRWMALSAAGILGVGGIDGGGLRGATAFTYDMVMPDHREVAADYLRAHSSDTTTVGLVSDAWFWTPTLYPDTALMRSVPLTTRLEKMDAATKPKVVQFLPPDPNQRVQWDPNLITQLKPDFITFSDYESNDFERMLAVGSEPQEFQTDVERYQQFIKLLKDQYSMVLQVGDGNPIIHDLRYVRPTVYVWKRK